MARKAAAPGFARLALAARRLASSSAENEAISSYGFCFFAGTVHRAPGAYLATRLVEASRRVFVFVSARVEVAQVMREPKEKAQILDTDVCMREMRLAPLRVRGLNEGLQYTQCGGLYRSPSRNFWLRGKRSTAGTSQRREARVRFERRSGLPCPVP